MVLVFILEGLTISPFPVFHCSELQLFGGESRRKRTEPGSEIHGKGFLTVPVCLVLFTLLPLLACLDNCEGG